LSAGASTLTSVITNTITGTAVGTPVSLYSESSRSGAIEIGNGGTRSGDIRIGNGVSTTGAVLIGRNGGGVSIGASGSTNTIDGTTNIANGTHSILGNTTINSGGTASTQLGNNSASAVVNILGAVSLNTTGSTQNTSIGNTTGTLSLIGDVNYADGDFSFATTTTNNLTPTSTVLMLLTSTVPTGWLYCDGSAVSRSTYSRLFAVISTTFGAGNGTTTFNIPNFKGAFLRGNDTQTVGGIAYTAAAVGTAQQDSVLEAYNEGFWNVDSGGGGSSRAVRARVQITGDPEDTGANSTTKFVRQNATENRVFNFAVYYYIKF
jgi:microcystin-dependent protein